MPCKLQCMCSNVTPATDTCKFSSSIKSATSPGFRNQYHFFVPLFACTKPSLVSVYCTTDNNYTSGLTDRCPATFGCCPRMLSVCRLSSSVCTAIAVWPLWSLLTADLCTNRKPIYEFILVNNKNILSIAHRFRHGNVISVTQ